jgi:uncharacterized protein HemX
LDTKTSGKGFVSPVILKVLIFPKGQFSRCLQRARLATQKAAFERQQYATTSGAQRAQCLNLYIFLNIPPASPEALGEIH